MEVSGDRSSWETLATKLLLINSRFSSESAMALKFMANCPTSSFVLTLTRLLKFPAAISLEMLFIWIKGLENRLDIKYSKTIDRMEDNMAALQKLS
jgi:hypothetical protein